MVGCNSLCMCMILLHLHIGAGALIGPVSPDIDCPGCFPWGIPESDDSAEKRSLLKI